MKKILSLSLKRPDTLTLSFWVFGLTVALLPIGFGGNRPIPFGIAQFGLAISYILLVMGHQSWDGIRLYRDLSIAIGLIALVMIWAFLQAFPAMPAGWVHPLWQEVATVLGTKIRGTIAIAPEDAIAGMTRLITYCMCGFLAFCLGQDSKRAYKLIQIFWLSGVVLCIYGLILQIFDFSKILWFDKWAYQNDLTSTFVNRNHFALYADIIMVCGVALMMKSWRDFMRPVKAVDKVFAAQEWLKLRGLSYFVGLFLVLLSIFLSHSRAGLVLSIVGIGGYLFFLALNKKQYRRAVVVAVIFLAVVLLAFIVASQFSDRFAELMTDDSSQDRITVYGLVLRAIQDNPWLGYGLNGFQSVFRLYQSSTMIMEFNRAHSDVLESVLDLGIPAAMTLWLAIGILISGLMHGIRTRQRDGSYPALGLAVTFIVLGHASIDFSLQIPGIVLCWVSLLGVGLAQSWSQRVGRI